jgi:hypothetical protein
VKKVQVIPESEEEAGEPKTPARANNPKAESVPVAGRSDGNGTRVGSRVISEEALLDLRAPLVSMARNFRRLVCQNAEFLEEFTRSQNIQRDLIANLCTPLREVPYQLHLRNMGLEEAKGRNTSEVSESVQQVPELIAGMEVGIQVGPEEVVESPEIPEVAEVAENTEVTEKVGTEGAGGEDETMKDA